MDYHKTTIFLLFLLVPIITAITLQEFVHTPSNDYRVDESTITKNETGVAFTLYKSKPALRLPGAFKKEITNISFSMNQIDTAVTRVILKDAFEQRWEVPELCKDYNTEFLPAKLHAYEQINSPFSLTFNESESTLGLFKSSLKYSDKYIEFDVLIPTNRVFGLGERAAHFALSPGTYTIWNHGQPNAFDNGKGGYNMYSSHTFYVFPMKNKSKFMAIYFRNSNAQDAVIELTQNNTYQITHKTTGGIIDLFIFHEESLKQVLSKYHTLIGRPYLPPFWSMGSQQCRWGYRSSWDIKRILRQYEYYEIPFDALTLDIDYMLNYKVFTVDHDRYPKLLDIIEDMHSKDLHMVLILDPGIKVEESYDTYEIFTKNNATIRSVKFPPFIVGYVWPGECVFPDFFKDISVDLWKSSLKDLYNITKFDGLMLDMLDIESFINGEVGHTGSVVKDNCYFNASNHLADEFDNLPYYPGNISLESGTLSMTGYHCAHNEFEDKVLKEYNTHNYFCYNESKISSDYYVELTNKRSFMLPRSTTIGSGHYTSHWQGDNWATWAHMRLSIAGLFSFQLFGIPHVGSDICGFGGNGDSELCARWYQVGSFYTFTRNHNIRTVLPQEPWWFFENENENERNLVINTARNSLKQKYSLLRLYYTRMIEAHLRGGYVVGPMYFEFPEDDTAFSDMEQSIMVGGAVLVSLALKPKQALIRQYLPNSDWYELKTGKRVATYSKTSTSGSYITLKAAFDYVNVHIRGGTIIPYQETESEKILRSAELLKRPIELIIALNTTSYSNCKAAGTVILEDGIKARLKETNAYKSYSIDFKDTGTSTINIKNENPLCKEKFTNELIENIRIYGLDTTKKYGKSVLTMNNGTYVSLETEFDQTLMIMNIKMSNPISLEVMKQIKLIEIVRDPHDL